MTESPSSVPNKGPTFLLVTGIMCAIAGILVIYRLLHGYILRKNIYTDDFMIAASMCVMLVTTVVGDLANNYGFGRHKKDVVPTGGNPVLALKFFWVFQVTYKLVLGLTKLSFLTFYLRIFPSKRFHLICHITMGVIIGGVIGFVFATIFQCIPVKGSWEKHIGATCINNAWFRWWWAGYNTATDIWICLLPMPLLARLQLNLVRKVGVMLMFALGLFVCVTSIIRINALVQSVATDDPTWGSWEALLWSAIEANCGIICACLPFLKHPLKQLVPKLFTSITSKGTRSRPTYNYKLSALSSRGHHGYQQTDDLGNLAMSSKGMGSQDPINTIGPGQVMVKTDISLRTEPVHNDEAHEIPGHAV
ncbi:hypothetical protein BGW36DRAFT_372151 [Talaromyces proteolyticus]|uniref:Rhodopsin domain-containing protein n=1 Tax=Talaromyces proteolyticus TaxID=1131652 RepID=A0AAD4L2L5_9EURO|nr:uncharacterized protein BGW36DRAFT_372151 [Talaromyces proteolyticus]KAH8702074.1 hypothetical protein BGW36DRAFT_372151 [Talaromyces proteolyticus]